MFEPTRGRKYEVWCPDGKVRTARATAEPDTMFTVPASVHVAGLTVSGFVTPLEGDVFYRPGVADPPPGVKLMFWPSARRKNAGALPQWPSAMQRPAGAPDGRAPVLATVGQLHTGLVRNGVASLELTDGPTREAARRERHRARAYARTLSKRFARPVRTEINREGGKAIMVYYLEGEA